jgi:glycosyltransferase involved in cell wall biosynthesis
VHTEKECAFDDEINKLGGKIFHVPVYKGKNHINYVKSWRNFFEKHPEYNIIHGHVRSLASIYLRVAKKYGLTTIAHSHSTSSGNGIPALVKNALQLPLRYIAEYYFACSTSAGEWLFGKRACNQRNFFVLKNAIETRRFVFDEEIRLQIRRDFQVENKFVIGHIGRFNTPKNHKYLIDIFKSVYDQNKNAVLILVGDGELRQSIQGKVENLGLENNVIFTGIRFDIPALLQSMDVLLFPSLYEGLPVTLIEAQAAGLPCVISNNITDAIKVTNLVDSLSLQNSADHWAKKVLEFNKPFERENTYNKIIESGYDINQVIEWYQEFLFSKIKTC